MATGSLQVDVVHRVAVKGSLYREPDVQVAEGRRIAFGSPARDDPLGCAAELDLHVEAVGCIERSAPLRVGGAGQYFDHASAFLTRFT